MMGTTIKKAFGVLSLPYLRWPLLAVFLLTLPWTVLIFPWYNANNFTYNQLNLWLILSIVVIGLNLLTGLTGMISLGHSAIYAVGAYVAGWFLAVMQVPFPIAIIGAAIGGGIVGFILGLPALRLSGTYLAVATFGFAIGVPQFLAQSKDVARLYGDPDSATSKIGIVAVPKQTWLGFASGSDLGRYYMFLVVLAIMVVLAAGLWRSRTGRALRAVRDSETAAQAMGVSLSRYKVLAFTISGIYAGVAGALYSFQVGQLDPTDSQFAPVEAVIFLAAIILGGLGSISGAIVGSAALTLLPTAANSATRLIAETTGIRLENFEAIFYGVIIIACIFYMPNGLVGAFKSLYERLTTPKVIEVAADEEVLESNLAIPDDMLNEEHKGVQVN